MSLGKLLVLTVKALSTKVTFFDVVNEIYRHFDGHRIGGYQLFSAPVMMVRDPDLINRILVKDFSYFHDHGFEVDTDVNPLEGHLFNMNGPQWRALRNKLTPTFTSSKLKAMLPQISDCADALAKILHTNGPQKDVLVRELISRFTIDVIGSCAFGLEAGALKDPDCEFNRMAKKIFRPTTRQIVRATFRGLFPKLALRLKLKTFDAEVTDFFFGITRQAFEHRTESGLKRNDFLDLLLQLKLGGSVDCDPKELAEEESPGSTAQTEEPEKLVLTDELLAAQSFVFLIAGWENLSVVISFTLYCLAKHPDAQNKARDEVRRVKGRHDGNFTYEALKEMAYLESCISESTRLYPPAAVLVHSCTRDYTMDDGRIIEKGTFVLVPSYALQKDAAYFEDPEEYRPERFMPEHCRVPNNVYLPFGDGPRICIARRFVLLEVKMVLGKLLDSFRFVNSPEMTEPIQFDPKSFMDIKGGMKMRFEPLAD